MNCALSIRLSLNAVVTMNWLLQTDSVNIVRWSCSSNAIMPYLNNIHFYYYYYYYYY